MAQNDEPGSEGGSEDSEAKATEGESLDDGLASAETRVILDEPPAESLETRVLDAEAPPVEMTEQPAPTPASEAATILADEEDDRTQLVNLPGPDGIEPDPAAPTRVMNPSAGPSASGTGAAGGQIDTRVLDDDDKTTPPPVVPASARASRPPPRPTPIDATRGLAPGTILFGEYEIVNVLGVGGMGEVYRAHHRRLDEHRAIKVMHAELSNKKGASEFFYREAKALLAVRHPAVVHCHDLLSDDQGRVYLIMEMIEGIPLSTKMNDGPLSPDDVAILGARVSHGLSAAHRKGVIHRDVSPDNIVLPNGRVQEAKLIDFGIAKILQEGEGTIVDGFKGKLSYASPEQLGFFGGKIDGRSDFYSLGLVLVAAALGRPIPMGTSVMEAVDARRSLQALPDAIPVGLRSAIQPLLALDPKDRPRYVDRLFVVPGGVDVDHDSEAFQRGVMSVGAGKPTESSGGRMGLMAGAAAALAILIGLGAYVALDGSKGPTAQDARPAATAPVTVEGSTRPAAEPMQPPGPGPVEPSVQEALAAEPEPKAVAKLPEPKPRRVTGSDRIKIIGLLNNAKLALGENRLMSPAADNAYDRYRKVLELDPSNSKAKSGLSEIARRYVALANASIQGGDTAQAKSYLDRAKRADARLPGIPAAEARLAR